MALETIVVAIGPTEETRIVPLTETVVDVAGPANASVVLYHAFTERALRDGIKEAGFDPEDPPDPGAVAERLESVVHLTEELDEAGIDYELHSGVEDPADGTLRLTEELDADMLFVGGRKRSSTGKLIFGSTSQQLMMNAPCPVVFVRDEIDEN
ncbi:universal stress protein [Halobaculum sp. EA56]|uniref:universal stress protein n=1 Tax=Halobaculum sp. EA56 TaxID=3421648 RepID=UPI003EBA023B